MPLLISKRLFYSGIKQRVADFADTLKMEKRPPRSYDTIVGLESRTSHQSQQGQLPSSSSPTSLIAGYQPPQLTWQGDVQKNKPQYTSMAAALLIFTSGGMSMAWSLETLPEYDGLSSTGRTHMVFCWFLAVIIGAALATLFIDKWEKRIFNLWGSGLVFINGIFFLSSPGSSLAVVLARYFDGIAVGLTIISAIVAGSEQAVNRFRGFVLSTEIFGLTIGIMLKSMFTAIWNSDWEFQNNQMQGIVALLIGTMAMLSTTHLTIESPVFFLRQNKDEYAINTLKRLQTTEDTNETFHYFYENIKLVKEDSDRGRAANLTRGYLPMIKLCFYRAFVSMSFSLPLTWGLIEAAALTRDKGDWWSLYIFGTMRMAGAFIAVFTLDTAGRKEPTAIALLAGGGLLMGVGSIFNLNDNLEHQTKLQTIIALLIIYQFMSGVAAPASSTYLGEAFSISVKPLFILVAVIFENVIQIIVICVFDRTARSVANFSFCLGAIQIVFAIFFVVIMPETKQITLRQALAKFQRHTYFGVGYQ